MWRDLRENCPYEVLASCSRNGDILLNLADLSAVAREKIGVSDDNVCAGKGVMSPPKGISTGNIELMKWKFENPYRFERKEKSAFSADSNMPIEEENSEQPIECFAQEYVCRQINESLAKYDRSAIYYFVFAALVNIPWLLSLLFFRDKLTYDASSSDAQ